MRTGMYWRLACAAVVASGATTLCIASARADGDRALQAANALLQRGLFEEAEAEYRSAIETLSSERKINEARYGRALALQRSGRVEEAVETLEAVSPSGEFAYRVDADVLLTSLLAQQGRFADAAGVADRVMGHADHPSWAHTAALRVELLHRASAHGDSVRTFRVLRDRVRDTDVSGLARAAFFAGLSAQQLAQGADEHADAAELLRIAASGSDAPQVREEAMLQEGYSWQLSGQTDRAMEGYRRALESGSSRIEARARLALGALLRGEGNPGEALEVLDGVDLESLNEPLRRQHALEIGLTLFDSGEAARAARALDRAVESEDPEIVAVAEYWRAKCDLEMGEYDDAADRLERAVDRHVGSTLAAEMAYDLGYAHAQAGRPDEASRAFSRLRDQHPDHALAEQALFAELLLAVELERFGDVIGLGEAYVGIHAPSGQSERAALHVADALYRSDEFDKAAEWCAELSTSEDEVVAARAMLLHGLSLHAMGESDQGGELLESVVSLELDDLDVAPAYFALSEIYAGEERWGDSGEAAARYLELAEGEQAGLPDATLLLGIARARVGNHRDAIEVLQRLVDSYEDSDAVPHALFELGQARLAEDEPGRAGEALSRLLDDHPDSRFAPHAMRILASVAAESGDIEAADELYERASASDDRSVASASVVDRARLLISAGRYGDAVDALRGAGGEADAWRVVALSLSGRDEDAVEQADGIDSQSLPHEVRDAYLYRLGVSLRGVGEGSRAESLLRSLGASPAYGARSALQLAEMAIERDDMERAVDLLRSALESDASRDADVCAALRYRAAWCHYRLEHPREVVGLLEDTPCEMASLRAPSALLLGEAYFALERGEDAAAQFEIALGSELDRADTEAAVLRLGEANAMAQDWDASRAAFERHREEFPQAARWFAAEFGLGWALENQGRHDDAIERYRAVVEDHDGETAARAQFQIGECLFAMERHDEAVRELLRVDILYDFPQWSAAALYEAGRCFEAMNKIGEARAQYRLVGKDHADSPWAEAARERLDALATRDGS